MACGCADRLPSLSPSSGTGIATVAEDDELEGLLLRRGTVAVLFQSPECGACHELADMLTELAGSRHPRRTILARVDMSRHGSIGFRYHVVGTPTLILFRDGAEAWRVAGPTDPDYVRERIIESASR